jgi:hypothetical protein
LLILAPDYLQTAVRVTASATGHYSASLPSMVAAHAVSGRVIHLGDDGLYSALIFGGVRWEVRLGQPCAVAHLPWPTAPITVTLHTPAGVFAPTAQPHFGHGEYCFAVPIEGGDQLSIEQSGGTTYFHVPLLAAEHDYTRQVLEGRAPEGSWVTADFSSGHGSGPQRVALAGADGLFGMDTSDLILALGRRGEVAIEDTAGNHVTADFWIRGLARFFPIFGR